MNLFKKDKNKQLKNEVETIGVNPTLEELEMFFGRKIGDISSSMLNSATYYACMQIRCNALAKLPIKYPQVARRGAPAAARLRGPCIYDRCTRDLRAHARQVFPQHAHAGCNRQGQRGARPVAVRIRYGGVLQA